MEGDIVLGIVIEDGLVLVGKTRSEKLQDFGGLRYVFPGGKVEADETPEVAVVRELKEETGLEVSIVDKIGKRKHPTTDCHIHYFHCQIQDREQEGNGQLNDDLEQLTWLNTTELVKYMPTINPTVLEYLGLK